MTARRAGAALAGGSVAADVGAALASRRAGVGARPAAGAGAMSAGLRPACVLRAAGEVEVTGVGMVMCFGWLQLD
jgi:hypothetical protein